MLQFWKKCYNLLLGSIHIYVYIIYISLNLEISYSLSGSWVIMVESCFGGCFVLYLIKVSYFIRLWF